MTTIALLGDHFVLPRLLEEAIRAAAPDVPLAFAAHTLEWPLVPFGTVAEVDEASGDEDETINALAGAEVCVTQMAPITDRVLEASPGLRLVCVTRGGPVNVNLESAHRRGVTVRSAPGRNADATAEHTVALMLAALRRIPERTAEVLAGDWRSDLYGYDETSPELAGAIVGLVGYGAVGSRVARILLGFGAQVRVFDPYADLAAAPDGVMQVSSLDEVLEESTVVTIHARLTDETRDIVGGAQIAKMPSGSVLVNAARGGLLDYAALNEGLRSGHLFGAGLDVYPEEPLAADSALRGAPHLVMTPHLAGATKQTAHNAARIAAAHVAEYLASR